MPATPVKRRPVRPWMIALVVGIVVQLPFLSRPVCLPVLARLWRPRHTGKIAHARQLVELIAAGYPDRTVHVVGDAAYDGAGHAADSRTDRTADDRTADRARGRTGRGAARLGKGGRRGKRGKDGACEKDLLRHGMTPEFYRGLAARRKSNALLPM